jgi:urease accessory protein
MIRRPWPLLAAALAIAVPATAFAHVEEGGAAGFVSGFLHPLSGWDHILAMVAVGIWGAQLGLPAIWVLPVTFPLVMAFGGFLGLVGVPIPGVELGIAASAIVLGAMVASQARPSLPIAMAIVAAFAIFHGYAHGAELGPGASAVAYSAGFVVATGLLHGLGILIGLVHKWSSGRRVLRLLGALVVGAGVFFMYRAVA